MMVVEAVNVRDGDTLIVQVVETITMTQADQLRAVLARDLPGVRCVLVPCRGLMVRPGPQLDIPARPLVDPWPEANPPMVQTLRERVDGNESVRLSDPQPGTVVQ